MGTELALLGGAPVRTKPFAPQHALGEEEKRAVLRVLDSGVLSRFLGEYGEDFRGGPQVRETEDAYARHFNVKHAISTNSGTTALHTAVAAAQIGPGDEVIVSPYTMSASATCILMQNAIPVFADVRDDTFCLDPRSVEQRITPHTRGIMVVHLFGHPAEMDAIREIAAASQIAVLEDAAQAIGATYQGRYVGTFGQAGVLSLNYHKLIHAGEGGIVLTDDDTVATRARMVRNHGEAVVEDLGWQDIANTVGSNYRMTEIEAAIAYVQLQRLEMLLDHRRKLGAHLTRRLAEFDGIVPPAVAPDATHSYYVYAIRVLPERVGIARQTLVQALRAEGIPFAEGYVRPLYYQPLYQQRVAYGHAGCPWTCGHYKGQVTYAPGICPTAERLHARELLLADLCHYPLTTDDMDDVADAFERILENVDALRNWEARQNEGVAKA